jgi:hypothetical protein
MKKIYRYPLEVVDLQSIPLPKGADILRADYQEWRDEASVWAIVDPEETEVVPVKFRMAGTGHELPEDENRIYIGSFHINHLQLMFHVFFIDVPTGTF